jgi:hypothetical protein
MSEKERCKKYRANVKRDNPELYRQRMDASIQRQREYNAELNEVMEYNKRFPLNRKIKTLKIIYITCKNKCTEPTNFMKCETCDQYKKYFNDLRNFREHHQLVYIGR